ncbi:MAG: hypothetical protein FWD80_01795 [Propionibacteriaceae bacterium]|nr:hypothetical protein [Propionibacteriaceae bacterium]
MNDRTATTRLRTLLALGVATVSLAALGLSACGVVTNGPGNQPSSFTPSQQPRGTSDPQGMANQSTLDDLSTWIRSQPECAQSGYLGQVNDSDTLSVRLLWYGDDPCLQIALAHAASQGINATVEHRSMSLQQIEAAQTYIWNNAAKYATQGFILSGVGAIGEVDGFDVMGTFTGPLAANPDGTVSPAVQRARQALSDAIAASVGCPVRLTDGGGGPL